MDLMNFTESLARACARRRWLTVGVWGAAIVRARAAVALLLSGALVTDVQPTNNPESSVALTLMNERLGQANTRTLDEMMIVKSAALTVDDPAFRDRVESIFAE